MRDLLGKIRRYVRAKRENFGRWRVKQIERFSSPLAERLYRAADSTAHLPFRDERQEIPPPIEVGDRRIDIVDDLVAFTHLPRDEVVEELRARRKASFRSEWWATPREWRSGHWYHLSTKGYLFGNATHFPDDDFIREFVGPNLNGGGRVYDFGAGSGNLSLRLVAAGHEVWCTELSALQRDFLRFRAHRHGLAERLHVVDWWQGLPPESFDLGVAMDVLEHVDDPGGLLDSTLLPALTGSGIFIEKSPFAINLANPMHREDFGLAEHLRDAGFTLIHEAANPFDDTRAWQRVP